MLQGCDDLVAGNADKHDVQSNPDQYFNYNGETADRGGTPLPQWDWIELN